MSDALELDWVVLSILESGYEFQVAAFLIEGDAHDWVERQIKLRASTYEVRKV